MLAPELVEMIRQLLAEDVLSQREMARRLGVSRTTIYRVATNQHAPRGGKRRRTQGELFDPDDRHTPRVIGKGDRCPTCGARVRLPCRACRVRTWLNQQRPAGQPGAA